MSRSSSKRWLAGWLGVIWLGALPALCRAQEAAPGVFGEVIDVRVVNLEVVVTDKSGNRVTGLGSGDFLLKVDGKETPIDYFNEVQSGVMVDPGAVAEGAPQSLPDLRPGAPISTSYLIFVDDFFAIERDRNKVLDSLRKQLPLMAPEDRMAIVAFDGRKLEMLSSWSQNSRELERTFRNAMARPAYGLQRVAERRRLTTSQGLLSSAGVRSAFQFPGGNVGTNLSPEEREYVELVTSQVERTVSAASATLRSFAMPPGRKVMLLLSGGWPYDPAQTAPEDKTKPVLDSDIPRAEKLFQPLADTANLLGYTLYPVDVPGLEGQGPDASEQTAPDPTTVNALDTPEREGETSLGYLAQRTGGRAMINALRINALGQAASDTRSFYWLGFSPQRQRNDKPHKVVVEVKKPGLKVRSRSGFLDFSRKSEVTGMVESTLLFGSSPTLGSLPVRVGEIKKAGGGLMEVPLEVAIPSDQITVVPTNGKFVSQLELRIAVIDEDGWTAEIPVIPLDLAGAKAPDPGSHIRYNTSVKLRKKKNDLVVALYDVASGKLISNRVQVHP